MLRPMSLLAAALLGCSAAVHSTAPEIDPAQATFRAHAPLPFDLFRGHRIFFSGSVNGTDTAMMLDSGASATVLDDDFAAKIGLTKGEAISVQGASGSVPGRAERATTIRVGGMTLTGADVLVIDLDPVSRAIGRPIPVVLGRDAMKASIMTIDFPARTIAFTDRASARAPAGATRIPLQDGDHLRSVPIAVGDDQEIQATLDIGNGGSLILANAYWKGRPALASLRYAETQTGGVGGLRTARRVVLPEIRFAGQKLANVPAVLNTDPTALPTSGGNVGIELLKPFVVTIDDSGGVMFLRPTGKSHAFQRERAGIRTEHAGDRLKVAYVSPDGPGADAGLRQGDEIVSIDGAAIGADYYERDEWTRGPAGRTVRLTRANGTDVTVRLADYY
jgi:hypothetical protein